MSKGLRSYPEHLRESVAKRRLAGNTKGNGYWGAVAYFEKKKPKYTLKVAPTVAELDNAEEIEVSDVKIEFAK